jgi:hypothetical protein
MTQFVLNSFEEALSSSEDYFLISKKFQGVSTRFECYSFELNSCDILPHQPEYRYDVGFLAAR